MNFTREPIIETIISPREGYRLIVRSTQHASDEEFTVDAVEIVSFGSALFYRSLEKPHPFLLPVADYQVVEGKESRVVLKSAHFERTIKIGGGRETSSKKETEEENDHLPVGLEDEASDELSEQSSELTHASSMGRKRERRRNRRRRAGHDPISDRPASEPAPSENTQESVAPKEPYVAPLFTHLIPPPPTLISDSIQKYKEQQAKEVADAGLAPEAAAAPQKEGEGDANTISRTLIEPPPFTPGVSTISDWSNFLS